MDTQTNLRLAQIRTPDQSKPVYARSDQGQFKTQAEAEQVALKVADSATTDAVIVQEDDGFHVYSIDELHTLMPPGGTAEVIKEAPIIAFVASDPLSGQENILGPRSSAPSGPVATPPPPPVFATDRYASKFQKQLDKVLGGTSSREAFLKEVQAQQQILADNGINITVELDDDVFENKDKIQGFKYLLNYATENVAALKERRISTIAIVDEYDNWFGVKTELEYDKKTHSRTLTLGDDFLDDWGESFKKQDKDSLEKLTDTLGAKLTPAEQNSRRQTYGHISHTMSQTFAQLGQLQQQVARGETTDLKTTLAALQQDYDRLLKTEIPAAEKSFKQFSVKQERELSLDELHTLTDTLKAVAEQIKALQATASDTDALALNGRMEKTRVLLTKGIQKVPDQKNYLGTYVSGNGNGIPGAGVQFTRNLNQAGNASLSARLGQAQMSGKNDVLFGLGFGYTVQSRNPLLDGLYAGVGAGLGANTPFMVGVNVSNSWYLTPYHGQEKEWSVVGGAHASVGTVNNIGAFVQAEKKINRYLDFEGSGELSLYNQGIEAETEWKLSKNKDVYLTAGIGTNKLLYAGIGFADQYELEVGLGGVSFGKDSNNLPGESGWEIGLRTWLPIPYFKHNRVPGYQFSYPDKSKEYITPQGTFMTIQKNAQGEETRTSYVPDPQKDTDKTRIRYRIVRSEADLKNLDKAPLREVGLTPMGYLTVTDNGNKLIDDGLMLVPLTEAEVGIITDQAGVLWYDKRAKDKENSLALRREEIPLPLFRAVHY